MNKIRIKTDKKVLFDFSIATENNTGLGNYTQKILDCFNVVDEVEIVAIDLHTEKGLKANKTQNKYSHLTRIAWKQFDVPRKYATLNASLLFSPVPELPLWTNCRGIVTVHDLIPLRFPNWKSLLYLYNKFYVPEVSRQAEHVICDSEATARDIVKFCGVPAKKISPILLGYDQEHFQPTPVLKGSASPPYFLYVGRHDPHKNIARIIKAFKNGKFGDETELWLVGSEHPRHTPALRQKITELGLSSRVKFLDYVPYEDLPRIISEAIALVFPSLWEGFGLPILEAMGCGTPVITSNLASMPEVAGDAAILVDPYNTAEITDAMEQVAADSQLRAELSELGLARAKLFSWEKTGRETVEVLKRFL